MARGTKNYFRHHNNAFFDEKIQKAIDLLGLEGYAYYFIILEILAKQCENEFINPIKIHKQSVRSVLRKQSKSCDKVVTKLQQSGLFVVTFCENFYEFDIPNLAKYMGKYESKNDLNPSNKRKENKRKENINIKKENAFDISNDSIKIIDYLNLKTNSKFSKSNKKTLGLISVRFGENFSVDDFKKVIDTKCDDWLSDLKMNKFLRPETLFGNKFESYLNQKSELENLTEEQLFHKLGEI